MAIRLGDIAPDFTATTTQGPIKFHEWLGNSWAVLFSHPKDFTPVCTTELGEIGAAQAGVRQAQREGHRVSASTRSTPTPEWAEDIKETQGHALNFPLIADADRKVSNLYDMIHPNANDTLTVRSVFIIDPNKKVRLMLTYPASTGRNFDEILRVIDSLQLTDKHRVATPVNWKQGSDVHHRALALRRRREEEVPRRLEDGEAVPAHRSAAEVSALGCCRSWKASA